MSKKIAIIGGGLTGLVSAYELSKKGFKVVIYEKEETLGGLASSFDIYGNHLEKFYHHIFETDNHLLELLKELGLEERLLWLESTVSIYRDNRSFPFSTPIDLLRFKPLNIIDRIRAGLIVLFLQKYKRWEELRDLTAYDWMQKYAGRNVTRIIWEPLLKGKFGHSYKDISMAWLWARIHIRANSRNKFGSGEKLGYLDGGFQVLIETLIEELESKDVTIKRGAKVSGLRKVPNRGIYLENSGVKELYDRVVITTPSPVVRDLFSLELMRESRVSDYLKGIEGVEYIGAVCLVFTTQQDLSKYYWHNINNRGSPFLVFIQHTNFVDKASYNNKHIYYICKYLSPGHKLFNSREEKIQDDWFNYLQEMYPNFDREKVENSYLFKSRYAQHIVDQKYYEIIPKDRKITNKLYLTNFSLIYPEDRGMNYAVREGVATANEIINE